jgi:succinoglycan biosynthesis transport protein ExoP
MKPESPRRGELPPPVTDHEIVAPTPIIQAVPIPRSGMTTTAPATNLSTTSLLRALRRRQMLALGVAILAAGIAGPSAWFLLPPAKYKAQARLQVAAQPPKVLFQTIENFAGDDYRRYQNTQQTLVKSRLVLNTALQDPKVGWFRLVREQIDPIAWLQDELKVEFVANSEVMEIALSGNDPVEIAGLVNAVKTAYMDEVVNVDIKRRAERHSKLKEIKEKYGDLLKERRQNLRKLAETVGSDDRETLALRQQYAMEHLEYLRKELLNIQSLKRRAEARYKIKVKADEASSEVKAPTYSEADIDALVDQERSVAALLDTLDQQEEQLNAKVVELRRVLRNPNSEPLLQRLRSEIKATRRLLAQRRAAVRPIAIRQLEGQAVDDQVVQNDELDQERAMLNDLERQLTEEITSISQGNQKMTVNTLNLQELQDTVAQMHEAAAKVGSEVEALNVELDAPSRIRLIEDAAVPLTRDQKKRFMMIAMITLGSFFGSLFGIAFLELQSRKVDSVDDVPLELGLTVVGALPILPSKSSRGGVPALRDKDRYLRNLLLESVDATRTMLVHAARTGSHRVVMITSAVGGEGKTSLASYLATSLARSGLRTLLVDADLRSPSIHGLFDLPATAGLSELLRGEAQLADVIANTAVEGLRIMTAGRCDRRTIRDLSQGVLGPIFEQLKEQFDFVIVDSSPILPVADASLIAQQVDAVLFSVFRDVSRKTKVFAALQRLHCLGVRILGAVVTGAHGGIYGNDYYDSEYTYSGLPESAADSTDTSPSDTTD